MNEITDLAANRQMGAHTHTRAQYHTYYEVFSSRYDAVRVSGDVYDTFTWRYHRAEVGKAYVGTGFSHYLLQIRAAPPDHKQVVLYSHLQL